MKALLPGDVTVIPSNFPRTRGGSDSRGIRICFQEIGRSCELNQGYMIFMDGSAYVYSAPSREALEQLCDSLIRGKLFNFAVRRAVFGFTRGFTPPADYEVIYEYPPYEGSKPGVCDVCMGFNVNIGDCTWAASAAFGSASITGTGDSIILDATSNPGDFCTAFAVANNFCVPEDYDVTATVSCGHADAGNVIFLQVGDALFFNDLGLAQGSSVSNTLTVHKGSGTITFRVRNIDGTNSNSLDLSPVTPP